MLFKFDLSNWCTDICKKIFVILEVQFHHEGGPIQRCYLELFFSAWSIFSPCKRSASAEAPFNLFWTSALILAKLVFKKCGEYFLVQNLGHNHLKKCKISCLEGLLNENKCLLLSTFCSFQTPLTLLTYSAMVRCRFK